MNKAWWLLAALLLAALVGREAAAQDSATDGAPPTGGEFGRVVGFGDSLTDSGNAFVLTGDFAVRPFEPVPDAPYLIGGLRFTNGPTWLEVLASELGRPRGGRPALLLPGSNTNFAIGGSRARIGADFPIDFDTQVAIFLRFYDQMAAADWLYAIWIGGNDLRDALEALADDPTGAASGAIIDQAIEATVLGIEELWLAGARTFLVLNLADVGRTPAARAAAAERAGSELTSLYNDRLAAALHALEDDLPGIDIIRFDLFGLLEEALADPGSFGFANITGTCITPGVIVGAICRRPDRYLYWDAIHPTAAAHRVIGETLAEELGSSAPSSATRASSSP